MLYFPKQNALEKSSISFLLLSRKFNNTCPIKWFGSTFQGFLWTLQASCRHFAEAPAECSNGCDTCNSTSGAEQRDITAEAQALVQILSELPSLEKRLTLLQLIDQFRSSKVSLPNFRLTVSPTQAGGNVKEVQLREEMDYDTYFHREQPGQQRAMISMWRPNRLYSSPSILLQRSFGSINGPFTPLLAEGSQTHLLLIKRAIGSRPYYDSNEICYC